MLDTHAVACGDASRHRTVRRTGHTLGTGPSVPLAGVAAEFHARAAASFPETPPSPALFRVARPGTPWAVAARHAASARRAPVDGAVPLEPTRADALRAGGGRPRGPSTGAHHRSRVSQLTGVVARIIVR